MQVSMYKWPVWYQQKIEVVQYSYILSLFLTFIIFSPKLLLMLCGTIDMLLFHFILFPFFLIPFLKKR